MNEVLSLLRAARRSTASSPNHGSKHMLAELLSLHEDMILQLQLEQQETGSSGEFIASMIAQHAKMAATLRAQLGHFEGFTPSPSVDLAPGAPSCLTGVFALTTPSSV